ncbi:MAG: M24 family metallopeptidase [Phycisphaerales bacterium]
MHPIILASCLLAFIASCASLARASSVSASAAGSTAATVAAAATATGDPGPILPMRERARVIDDWLAARLQRLAPALMREHDVDMWIIIGREYDEDPVLRTMLPAEWLAARRRTILVLHDPGSGDGLERLAVARYAVGDQFASAWDPDTQPDQWARLAEIVAERDPARIAINVSPDFALADGLSHSQHAGLFAALPEQVHDRIVPAGPLAIGWLERRLPEELEVYASVCRIAHEIMAEALSERTIQPGVTTTDDLKWWVRDRIRELGLTAWFHPLVSVQRHESGSDLTDLISGREDVIHRGDLIHMDMGISYLRLHTDTQQMAYVLRSGETAPPEGLQAAFAVGNRMQDILTDSFGEGRSGNAVLADALAGAKSAGIDAMVYSHPIGFHGHAAGPAIGMWDKQGGVPIRGDLTIHDRTAYAIELSVSVPVAEWGGQDVRIMLEEDAVFADGRVRYLDGRQTQLRIVR